MCDMDLGRRFIIGGEDELEEVINLYGEKLLRYATAILCDYHEAENVIQEVFLSAYKSRSSFDGDNLSAWLYKITYNRSLNQLKKRKLLYFRDVPDKVDSTAEDTSLSDEALCALKRLKPKERALVYARIIDERSYEELSRLTGISQAALRKQYQRAKNKLAAYLNDEYFGKELKHE